MSDSNLSSGEEAALSRYRRQQQQHLLHSVPESTLVKTKTAYGSFAGDQAVHLTTTTESDASASEFAVSYAAVEPPYKGHAGTRDFLPL